MPAPARRSRRPRRGGLARGLLALSAVALLALAGCSKETGDQLQRGGLPGAAGDRAPYVHNLWIGSWIAAGIVGVTVWGLIGYASVHFRSNNNDMPRQNRYNLPMEIFYTLTPFIIIGVLFYYTILAQTAVQRHVSNPQVQINVLAQKWSWVFNYDSAKDDPAVGAIVHESGTIDKIPDLYLPVNQQVRFNLQSADVIHDFWVPSFYEKLDVVPGRLNTFDVTPTRVGVFKGKCAELCGTYHSAMLFNVHIVSPQEYTAHLKALAAAGQTGEIKGPASVDPSGENKQYEGEKVGAR